MVLSLPGNAPIQGAWHVYGVLWTETGYPFLHRRPAGLDDGRGESHRSEDLQLTCEVADASWAGYIPAGGYGSRTTSTTKMDVDRVRVWQKE